MAQAETTIFFALLIILPSVSQASEDHTPPNCAKLKKNSWQDYVTGVKQQVQFLLFTRQNPECGQLLSDQDDIPNSAFNNTLDTKVIIHGFRAISTIPSWTDKIVQALLHAADVNVVVVDFHGGTTYNSFVQNMINTGLEISGFISNLIALGSTETSLHLIGLSLGAHVAGFVGSLHGGRLGQITGLDPAGPQFTHATTDERLDPSDALFVEAIHTDADNLGIRIPVGHMDYFINGGKDQPACPDNPLSIYRYMSCDHTRAVHVYLSAINSSCPMFGIPCSSYEEFLNGNCVDCFNPFFLSCPRIGLEERGGIKMKVLPQQVKLYLMTAPTAPFCAYHSLIEMYTELEGTANVKMEIKLTGKTSVNKVKVTIPKSTTHFKRVIVHQEPICNINALQLKYTVGLSRSWSAHDEEHLNINKVCISELPFDDSGKTPVCLDNLQLSENTDVSFRLQVACH